MTPFTRILCPVDFSDCSRHALDYAIAVARDGNGSVKVLRAVHPLPYADPLMAGALIFTPEDLDRAERELSAFVSEIASRKSVPMTSTIAQGEAAAAILAEAEAWPANLVVLGTHGRSGFEALMLGSVTERVLRQAPCPVLTVPTRSTDAPVLFRTIVCALDFSPASVKALDLAASLRRASNGQLAVLHALEPRAVLDPVPADGRERNGRHSAMTAACEQLHELVPRDLSAREVITRGTPYEEILRYAGRHDADLIVLGVHSGLPQRFGFLGSTASRVVREATCPVLSVRT